jgi:hypothetical protein
MALLKSGASRQEKASGCNGNGAPANADIANPDAIEGRLNRDAAGAEHLDTLFEDDRLVAGRKRVAY